jgi:hypothetical protein
MRIEDTVLIKDRGWEVTLTLDCPVPTVGTNLRRLSDGREWTIKGTMTFFPWARAGDRAGLLVVDPGLDVGDEIEFVADE